MLKIRQSDEETQTLVVEILEGGLPKSYSGLDVFFCAKIGQATGLGIIEQKLTDDEMYEPKNGVLKYTFRPEDWQVLGRQTGYFSFRKMKDDHSYVQQFSTRDFTYEVTKSIYSDGIKEVTKDGSTYVWTFEDLLRLLQEFKDSGETDFLAWFDEIKDQLSEDAAGNLMLLYQSLRDKTGEDNDFRGFESQYSYMRRVANETQESYLNASWFEVKGDGTDETQKLQNAVQALSEGQKLIIPRGKTIVVTKPIEITKSNVFIDFQGSTLDYRGTNVISQENSSERNQGAINVKGMITNVKSNVLSMQSVGLAKTHIDNSFSGEESFRRANTCLELENASLFEVNDYVYIDIYNNGSYVWNSDKSDNPAMINCLAKVTGVLENKIYVDFKTGDFIFNNPNFGGTVTKVNVLENITIENFNFIDTAERLDFPMTDDELAVEGIRGSWVNGIYLQYCHNVKLNNITGRNTTFPLISARRCHNTYVDKLEITDPKIISAGCGYGAQFVACLNTFVKNAYGSNVRHLVDFSRGGNAIVADSVCVDASNGAFDLHGIGEFGITFDNCTGTFLLGNGAQEFPEIIGSVVFNRCTGSFFGGVSFATDLIMSNCDWEIIDMTPIRASNLVISNSKIRCKNVQRSQVRFVGASRGGKYQMKCAVTNTDIYLDDFGDINPRPLYFAGFRNLYLDQTRFDNRYVDTGLQRVYAGIVIDCEKVSINGVVCKDLGFTFSNALTLSEGLVVTDVNYVSRTNKLITIENSSLFISRSLDSTNTPQISFIDVRATEDAKSFMLVVDKTTINDNKYVFGTNKNRYLAVGAIDVNTTPIHVYLDKNMIREGMVKTNGAGSNAVITESNSVTI